ncbi:hypothetical protein O9H85_08140 [Paenibacillus filicis]|uniref:Phage protein n=1 Tax=Paenibacillus gyeongsangnamensis TaxID=3388067 RepID=A0ABT4Q6A0_9BACL|nr:hypothetical protein [Paenibacillus filicis]MCZ8512402.1 hypothetical protein [Paenibacillus filicis]
MENTIKIDLSEQLGEGQYVEIRNPKILPWGLQKELAKAQTKNTIDNQIDFETSLEINEKIVVALIKNLNVNDFDGQPIELPITNDTIDRLPVEVIVAVVKKFSEIRTQGTVEKKN